MDPENPTSDRPAVLQWADWSLDPVTGRLRRGAHERVLAPVDTAVLRALLAQPGEVLSKQALLDAAWHGAFVTDDSVWQSISRIRKALGDDPRAPRYIETLPRRGYRLVNGGRDERPARAFLDAKRPAPSSASVERSAVSPSRSPFRLLGSGLAVAAAIGLFWVALSWRTAPAAPTSTLLQVADAHFVRQGPVDLLNSAATLNAYLKDRPDSAAGHALLGRVLATQANRAFAGSEAAHRSLEHARRATSLAPRDPGALLALSEATFVEGRLDESLDAALGALADASMTPEIANQLALVMLERGDLADAVRLKHQAPLSRAIDEHFFAIAQARVGNDASALRHLRRGLEVEPFNELSLILAAQLLAETDQPDAAAASLRRLLAAHPGSAPAWSAAGYVARFQGSTDQALAHYRKATEIAGRRSLPRSWLGYAEALTATGGATEAESILTSLGDAQRRVIADGVSAFGPRLLLAGIDAIGGRADGAAHWLREAIGAGFRDLRQLDRDPLFAAVRGVPVFAAVRNDLARRVAVDAAQLAAVGGDGQP